MSGHKLPFGGVIDPNDRSAAESGDEDRLADAQTTRKADLAVSEMLRERVAELEAALHISYKRFKLPSGEPVDFVGVHGLELCQATKPTVGFRQWEEEEIAAISVAAKE